MNEVTIILLLFITIFVTGLSAFFILLISRLGARNYVIERSPKKLSEMFSCDFCLSFWTALLVAVAVSVYTTDPSMLLTALLSTPFIRILL